MPVRRSVGEDGCRQSAQEQTSTSTPSKPPGSEHRADGARHPALLARSAENALQPAYTGIRPKIVGPGAPAADFRIDGPGVHGVAGLVNLFGIESPGLTASLALAEHAVAALT